jgi:hypothetical protein
MSIAEREPTPWDNPPDTPIQMIITGRWTQSPGARERLAATLDQLVMDIDGYLVQKRSSNPLPPGISYLESIVENIADLNKTLGERVGVKRHVSMNRATIAFAVGEGILPQYLDALEADARALIGYLNSEARNPNIDLLPTFVDFDNKLTDWRRIYLNPILDEIADLRADSEKYKVDISPEFQENLFTRQAERLNDLEQQARETVGNIRSAGHEAGSERLASTFEKVGKSEDDRSRCWTTCVFACLLAGIAVPILILSFDLGVARQIAGPTGTIVKLLISLPLFAGAAYCARIAAQHRETSRHMSILTAQIDSIRAYIAQLPSDTQDELVTMLGKRAFSSPELTAIDKGKLTVVPEALLSIVEKALDIAKDVAEKKE